MKPPRGRASQLAVLLCCLLYVPLSVHERFIGSDGQAWRTVISSDGEGYAAYLDGVVIQHDLAHVRSHEFYFSPAGQGRVIKYFCGTALLEAPFFLLGHAWCALTSTPMDGRSMPYQIAIGFSSLVFLLIGLACTRSLLLGLCVNDRAVAFTLLLLILGTGLMYYAVMTPSLSHVYSFAMVAWWLDAARKAWQQPGTRTMMTAALAFGIVILVRPTNGLIIAALPVASIGSHQPQERSMPRIWSWILAASTLLLVLCVQPVLWRIQCGAFFARPYSTEGFLWSRPMGWSLLFGARKGLFFYWPSLLLMWPGLWFLYKRSFTAACSLLLTFGLCAYVIGCWYNWYYGWSYGSRPFIDLIALLAVPIAFLVNDASRTMRTFILVISLPLWLLQCFQVWQYQRGIIHPFNMDREKYRMILLRGDDRWRGAFGSAFVVPPYAPRGFDTLVDDSSPADAIRWSGGLVQPFIDGAVTCELDSLHPSSPVFTIGSDELPVGRELCVEVALRRRAITLGASHHAEVVCSFHNRGKERAQLFFPLNDIPLPNDRIWRHWRYTIDLPRAEPGDELRIHIQLNGGGAMLIEGLRLRISAVR